ncbi:MAG: ABC transporter substrate-binding protein [Granulosicoccus sp.]|nr:ABC transporter substrate-binding protein [Granulosicoccus sp.]
MTRKKFTLLGLGLMSLAFSTQGLSQDTLVYCSEGSPEGFDPALYTAGTTFDASSRQVYNKLVEFERGTTTIAPALAESYTISDDGLVYTFSLRPGVKFHSTDYFTPTRDLNADDVVFSFERQRLADNPYNQVSGGTWEYFNGMSMPDLIDSVEAVDELTVRFSLTRPEAPMIANLGMDFASILSEEYAASLLEKGTPEMLNQQPIGTGPFKFVGYQKDAVIRFQAHEDYWSGKAAIDNLVFAITPDNSVGYQKLKAGECHVLGYPNPADIAGMQSDDDLVVLEQEGLNVGYLAYNTQVAPFDNVNVRKALNMAINKQAILDSVFQGSGKAAKNPIPPTIWSYNDAVVDDPYDPETAKAMLAAEGVENLKMDVWAMPVVRPYNPNARRMAEVIQEDFAKIGVEVNIVSYEWGEYLKLSKELNRQGAVLLGWTGDNGDPDNFLAVLLGCDAVGNANRAQWCHEPFDDLIQQAKVVSDQAERTRLYEQAQLVFKEQAPWATIAHSVVYKTVRKEVQDFRIDPFGGHIFYGVSLAR